MLVTQSASKVHRLLALLVPLWLWTGCPAETAIDDDDVADDDASDDDMWSDGDTELFDRNHQFHRLDDSMLVFVNGDESTNCSDVREYAYAGDGGEVELVWSYVPDPCVFTFSLGDVSRLDSGNTMTRSSRGGRSALFHQAQSAVVTLRRFARRLWMKEP